MRLSHFVVLCMLLVMGLAPGNTWAREKAGSFTVNQLGLVPRPRKVTAYAAKWSLPATLRIVSGAPADRNVARFLQRFLKNRGVHAQIVSAGPAQINLSTTADDTRLGHEGYRLTVTSHSARIIANAGPGLFYGTQTFEQLFNPAVPTENAIHEVVITDWPRYRWRGITLDSVRHFFPVSVVEKFIRVAAHYKLDVFHWHLTDDEGWRIQIPQYPLLTKIGAWRSSAIVGSIPAGMDHGKRYGGFYTDAEIRKIVAYAQRRYITIVPEFDIPGHCTAALTAYPWLADSKGPFHIQNRFDVASVPLSPSPRTFKFLDTVYGDLVSLFPGKFIHIGGDEVPMHAWLHDPSAEKLMRQRHWTLEQVHDYFARKMARFLASKGRRAVVWNDVPAKGLPAGTVVEFWNGTKAALQEDAQGHDVIITSGGMHNGKLYFDHVQGDPKYEKYAAFGIDTLRDVYDFNPSGLLIPALRKRLLGAEGCLWTEFVPTAHHLFYQLLPREMALAEICWTPLKEQRYSDFVERTARQYLWLRANGYNFRIPPPAPRFIGVGGHTNAIRVPSLNAVDAHTTVSSGLVHILEPVPDAVIHYTLNGSIPTVRSPRYTRSIGVKLAPGKPLTVRSVAIDPSGRSSAPSRLVLRLVNAP